MNSESGNRKLLKEIAVKATAVLVTEGFTKHDLSEIEHWIRGRRREGRRPNHRPDRPRVQELLPPSREDGPLPQAGRAYQERKPAPQEEGLETKRIPGGPARAITPPPPRGSSLGIFTRWIFLSQRSKAPTSLLLPSLRFPRWIARGGSRTMMPSSLPIGR